MCLGNPLKCDCEMRWYKRWYNDGWQDVDEDHIRETSCQDPYDGREHNIAEVDKPGAFDQISIFLRIPSGFCLNFF